MNLLRKLVPSFLRQWDQWLQQNRPRLWSTRIHLHLWFLLLINAAILTLGLLLPVNERKFPEPEAMWGYMILPAIVYLAFWIFKVVLFTPERRFGERRTYAEVWELLVHALSLLLIASIPYTLALTVTFRIAAITPDEAFVEEVNLLNRQSVWILGTDRYYDNDESDEARYTRAMAEVDWDMVNAVEGLRPSGSSEHGRPELGSGTHQFFRSLQEYSERDDPRDDRQIEWDRPLHDIYSDLVDAHNKFANPADTGEYGDFNLDSARVYSKLIDSIETRFPLLRVELSPFKPYEHPDIFDWLPPHLDAPALAFLSDSVLEQLYLKDVQAKVLPDPQAIARALSIANKYDANVRLLNPDTVIQQFEERRASTSSIFSATEQIGLIGEAKDFGYFWAEWEFLVYGMFLTALALAILVSIFKNIYWQPFLIMIVCCILLPIVILILVELIERPFSPWDDDDLYRWIYYTLALGVVLYLFRIPRLKAYRTRAAVIVILANLVVPVLPVFTLGMLDHDLDVFGRQELDHYIDSINAENSDDPRLPELRQSYWELRQRISFFMLCAVWSGIALYIGALHPIFRWVYTRLMALPETK